MLQKFDMYIPPLNRAATIHLHLPDRYYESQDQLGAGRFPEGISQGIHCGGH